MTNSEKIDLLLAEMQGMKSDMQSMKSDMRGMKSDMQDMKFIKQTERVLRNEIKKEFGLVLDEIERVHSILDKHKADASMHCITAF